MVTLAPDVAVAANLRAEQARTGVTNVGLAEQLRVSRRRVHQWRTGAASMTVAQLAAAADYLGCNVADLIDGVQPTPLTRRAAS